MSEELRARILDALNTAPCAEVRDIPSDAARYASMPQLRHDRHHFHAFCALCSGEAETLADAIMAAIAGHAFTGIWMARSEKGEPIALRATVESARKATEDIYRGEWNACGLPLADDAVFEWKPVGEVEYLLVSSAAGNGHMTPTRYRVERWEAKP